MEETPQGAERRLVLRLLAYWRDICDSRDFPKPEDVDPEAISELWPDCFILRLDGESSIPMFAEVGSQIGSASTRSLKDHTIVDAPADSLIDHATHFHEEVVRRRVPITRGGAFADNTGVTVLYRSILLPLSDNWTDITALLGAANCREVTQEALDAAKRFRSEEPRVTF